MLTLFWHEHFHIFYKNLSTYYIWCFLITSLVIISTILYHYFYELNGSKISSTNSSKEIFHINLDNEEEKNETKISKLKIVQDKLYSNLTEEQKEREKIVEQEQLRAIHKLLQETAENQNTSEPTLEELEEQLKLYR